ncbi:Cyanogenic beta-glucosidase [Bienertia sinuspersici]
MNEPWSYTVGGNADGDFSPGKCSKWQRLNCTGGDSATEPYNCTPSAVDMTGANIWFKRFQFANRYMYPRSMQSLVKGRLPKLSAKQLWLVNGSFDFLGLDYYIAYYASYSPALNLAKPSYDTDAIVKQ